MTDILKANLSKEEVYHALEEVEANFCTETLGEFFKVCDRADGIKPEKYVFDEVTDTDIKVTFENGESVWYTIR